MQVFNKCELRLENYEKCHLICDNDCSLGQLFDYSCALQVFITEKMKAAQENNKSEEPKEAE